MSEDFTALPTWSSRREVALWGVLWVLVVGLFSLAVLAPEEEKAAEPAGRKELVFQARYALGMKNLFGKLGGNLAAALSTQLSALPETPAERLCVIPVLAELLDRERALDEIARLRTADELPDDVRQDLTTLERIYNDPQGEIAEEDRRAFLGRREWFARLALSYGADEQDPERRDLLQSSTRVATIMAAVVAGVLSASVAGLGLLVLAFLLHRQGKLQTYYHPRTDLAAGAPDGQLPYLETLVVFILATLGASFLGGLVLAETGHQPAALAVNLLAISAVFWPLLRGRSLSEMRHAYGWDRGQGLLREALWGLVGYVAGAPFLILGILLSLALAQVVGQEASHPLMESVTDASPLGILMIYILACVSAPLVEETVFRGGFYHFLRERWRIPAAALLVSAVFAFIHPQGILGVPPLMALAMVLALIREWRGSLVASVAVHAVHNGIATTILFVLLG